MKKTTLLCVVFMVTMNQSTFSQSGWVLQNSGTSITLNSVHFIDWNYGWACGDSGTIIRTTNGGLTWTQQNSTTTLPILKIMFADNFTGWAIADSGQSDPLCQYKSLALKTTNGGLTWFSQGDIYGLTRNDLYVLNTQTAFISRDGICCPPFCIQSIGAISSTTNSGQNWSGSIGQACFSVFFLNNHTGWVAANSTSDVLPSIDYIYKTENGGSNWTVLRSDTVNWYPLQKHLMFADETTGYLIKDKLLKTTDGGLHWKNTDSIATLNIHNYHFINKDTGWIVGRNGKIMRTNDGGSNWVTQISNTPNHLNSIHTINSHTGWIVGSLGTVLKTITGGLTSVIAHQSLLPDIVSISQNFPNPFNPKTIVKYELQTANHVVLKVFDVNGKEVRTMVNEKQSAGSYEVEFDGSGLANGIYFYRIEAGYFSETKRMILIK